MAGGRKTVFLRNLKIACFQGTAWLRSRRFPFHQLIQGDKSQTVILDVDALAVGVRTLSALSWLAI